MFFPQDSVFSHILISPVQIYIDSRCLSLFSRVRPINFGVSDNPAEYHYKYQHSVQYKVISQNKTREKNHITTSTQLTNQKKLQFCEVLEI